MHVPEASASDIRQVLLAYHLQATAITVLESGLLNRSYRITGACGNAYILQAVNPVFDSALMEDIEHITSHLAGHGITTPRVVKTNRDELYTVQADQVWRLYDCIEGDSRNIINGVTAAESAGSLLARIHVALDSLEYSPGFTRPGVHDTARHLQHLRDSLQAKTGHPAHARIAEIADDIFRQMDDRQELPSVTARLVHGDPKISNFIFESGTDRALCMVDFDTFNYMAVYLEIGDALRSWCNPRGEDDSTGIFSADIALAALSGYAAAGNGFLLPQEWCSIFPATHRIYLELAARFCSDALNEDYFAWDPDRFESHSLHSETRARGQLAAAASLAGQIAALQPELDRLFS